MRIFTCRFCFAFALLSASRFAHAVPDLLSAKIVLTDGVTRITRARADLGFVVKSQKPIQFALDLASAKRSLTRIARAFNKPAVNASLVAKDQRVGVNPGRFARTMDVAATAEGIRKAVANAPGTMIFRVAVDKKPPVLTADRLKGINAVLSDFTTRTSDNPKRNHNVGVASARINGTLLSPGEAFSLNKTVGKRTQANGFRTAHVFEDGKVIDGIGGGVSQVSGTLFNAAALAGLQIDAAQPHSRPVPYLPLGRDTTASDEGIDLRFTNNTKSSVYIAYKLTGRRLHTTIFGTKVAGQKIALRSQIKRLAPGKVDAQTYRIVRQNGKVVAKTRLFAHKYRWEPEPTKP